MLAEISAQLARWGIEDFERAGWLALAIPAGIALFRAARARPPVLGWSAISEARAAGARRFDPIRVVSLALRGAALLALAAVLAGPVGVHRLPPEPGYGLDLVLVVDASGSMRALDAVVDGERRTRLELAKEVVTRFAEHRAAEGDRVALVVFGESAFTQCPLTSDGGLLAAALSRVEAGVAGEATALGDALALAVKRAMGATDSGRDDELLAGRVVVLLTDGRNNAGALSVELATAAAASAGIRVHTVATGSAGARVEMAPAAGTAVRSTRLERHDVDPEALRRISAATGGRFFSAQRSGDLAAVYREIDALERVARPLPPRVHLAQRPEPLLALAGGCLFFELAAARVLRRRLP